MRFKFFILGTFLLILLSGCSKSSQKELEFSYKGRWELSGVKNQSFRLDCDNGNIIIRGKDGINKVTVGWTKKVYWQKDLSKSNNKEINKDETKKIFDDMELQIDKTLREIYIKARAYKGEAILSNTLSNPKKEFIFDITLPSNMNLIIQNSNGNINFKNIKMHTYIVSGNGNIKAKDIKGTVSIKNGAGNIDLDYISGNILINNGSGDININAKAMEQINITNTLGNITARIDGINGSKNSFISSGNGDVSLKFTKNTHSILKIITKGKVKSDFGWTKQKNVYLIDVNSGKNQIEIVNLNGTTKVGKGY